MTHSANSKGAKAQVTAPAPAQATATNTDAPTPQIMLGTAGHIDHGKSSLVRLLTGTDPDRLAEEKRRGITIELGFAGLTLPNGTHMGVVDVPGHERFVRHMVAGATGIDVALLVIAADDGIMPQTVEHMAVLELLEVRTCVVALTKIDLVDADWRQFITDEIASALASTAFAGAPIVGVSSQTGEGRAELLRELERAAATAQHTKVAGAFRMPIDRAFTVKGFGTVVTGSLWSGCARPGLELTLLPGGAQTRIRTVQMHGQDTQAAPAGNRVAVSLAGLTLDNVRPGQFLTAQADAQVSDRFDAQFTYLDPFSFGKPLKSGARIHVAHGTTEVLGRILFMDNLPELTSGQRALAQIRLEEPLPVAYRDRFVVRSYSPAHVIGGGMVLTAHPRRRTTLDDAEKRMLGALENSNTQEAIGAHLEVAKLPETLDEITQSCGLETHVVARALEQMESEAALATLGSRPTYYARPALVQKLLAQLERALLNHHTQNPTSTGVSKEALRQLATPGAAPACFNALLDEACQRGVCVHAAGSVAHPRASAGARKAEDEAAQKILAALTAAAQNPPDLSSIAEKTKIDIALARKAAAALVQAGKLERIDANRYYDSAVTQAYRRQIADFITKNGPATASQLKEAMQTTRKYAMPLLEHFDACGFTIREGDLRRLSAAATQ